MEQVRVISDQYGSRRFEPVAKDAPSVPPLGGVSLAHAERDIAARADREKLAKGPVVSPQVALAARELLKNMGHQQAIEMLLSRIIELESKV